MLYHLLSLLIMYNPHRPSQTTPTNFTDQVNFLHLYCPDILNVNESDFLKHIHLFSAFSIYK